MAATSTPAVIAVLAVIAAAPAATPQTANTIRLAEGAAAPPATIASVGWLTGTWAGEGLGGTVDEVWSAPEGGAMVGHFRLLRGGKPVFYELMTILEHEGSLELRLKHVNADMTGWEEKNDFVRFRLAKIEPDAIYFSGLTFRRISAGVIEGYLALRDRSTNVVREEKFVYRRVTR